MSVVEFVKHKLLMIILFCVAGFFFLFASFAAKANDQPVMCVGLIIGLIALLASGYYYRK